MKEHGTEKLKTQVEDLRNYASHTYKEKLAKEVYAALPEAKKRFDTLLSALERGLAEIPN